MFLPKHSPWAHNGKGAESNQGCWIGGSDMPPVDEPLSDSEWGSSVSNGGWGDGLPPGMQCCTKENPGQTGRLPHCSTSGPQVASASQPSGRKGLDRVP
jgi:hypothetical protein